MTEEEARALVLGFAGTAAMTRLYKLVEMVKAESSQQNLIARSTLDAIWSRHIFDSVQLLRWTGNAAGLWVDVGTGAGFPGLAVAAVTLNPMMLVEPRRRRADFLRGAAADLSLGNVTVEQKKVEAVQADAAIISARAVAPIEELFNAASRCSSLATRWILPRGAGYAEDVTMAQQHWTGVFHVEQSLSDPQAGIVIASQVSPR